MMPDEKEGASQGGSRQRSVSPLTAVIIAICCVAITAAVCLLWPAAPLSDEQLFREALIDSVTVEDDEIFPLVTITRDSDMVTWKDDKVLLLTVNDCPESYIAGKMLALPSEVWTTTDKEFTAWYNENKKGVDDWTMRIQRLLGVPPDSGYTHVSAMWVSPEDVLRPAYNTDITTTDMPIVLPKGTPEEYKEWFNNNIIWSYFDSAFPWTRLGYTYDWEAGTDEYGLTEFWVRPEAEVMVEYTDTIEEFINRLEQKAAYTNH